MSRPKLLPKHRPEQPPVAVLLQQGIALYRQGQYPAAEDVFTRVLLADPGEPHSLHLLGLICHRRGDLEMAESLIARSVQLAPHSRAHHNLGVVRQQQGRHDAAVSTYRQALALEPDYYEAAANLIFALDLHPHATPDLLLAERLAFAAAFCDPLTELAAPHTNDRDPERRLRVGYVGADFKHHSAASAVRPFITNHDPAQLALYLYSTAEAHDDATAPFRDHADVWAEVAGLDDAELAEVIRADGIDVLVDLGGYSKGGRLPVFARRPAPVQVTGWGYATGTGLASMDYLVADEVAVPPAHEGRYRERIMRLPAMLAYDPATYPEIGPAPAARNGYRTYGYLGRAVKLNGPTLAAWASILRSDPTGRLFLKGGEFEDRPMRERVAQALLALGVSMDRVEVRGSTSRLEHLEAYNRIDVALDPFPHGGGVTTLDAALMGVVTVTLAGATIPGRTGASVMAAVGCDWWVASNQEQYADLARSTLPERGRVRDALLGSIIVDGKRYARSVEAAFRQAWREWVAKEAA